MPKSKQQLPQKISNHPIVKTSSTDAILPQNDKVMVKRLANLKSFTSNNRYAKRGIIFSPPAEFKSKDTINLYNHGFPEINKYNDFRIFDTGDAFSIISPELEFNNANVNIHVGVQHATYSPLALLQEALQLSRCSHEHGAKEITIALPEQYHPILHPSDFNILLINLFKVSGASNIYYYDKKSYENLPGNSETLLYNKESMMQFLQWNPTGSTDDMVKHHMRKHAIKRVLSQLEMNQASIDKLLDEDNAPTYIQVPEIKNPPHILLCCSANQPFAKEIANKLNARGEAVQIYNVQGRGEQANIPPDVKINGATVTIVQSTRPSSGNIEMALEYKNNGASSYFFEAIMIARQAHIRGAKQVNLVNPYQFGSRSDKAENNTKGKTGAYVQLNGLLLEAAGVNHVITAECHDPHTLSGTYTGKKIQGTPVQALTIIAKNIADKWLQSERLGQLRLVTPDAGAAKRTKELTLALQSILKTKLCESRILGEKERGSHKDDSALISNLNYGSITINSHDKYLITDDETATGSTLCQAVQNLKKQGAQDISVIIVHNNMPINWLFRQLSLTRFLFLGVKDLHFSNTQEMGILAKNYEDIVKTYSQMTSLSPIVVEAQILQWFKENLAEFPSSFDVFKETISQISTRVTIHDLSESFVDAFASKLKTQLTPIQDHLQSSYKPDTLFSASSKISHIIDNNTTKNHVGAGYGR